MTAPWEEAVKLAAAITCAALAACSSNNATSESASNLAMAPVTRCVERGVAYFQKIGSYPALHEPPNEGRAAEEVAQERCQRTLGAF